MRVKIGLPTIGGAILSAPSLWQLLKWILDWKGRYDSARSLIEGGMFNVPPWVFPILFIAGLLLIWWDTRRKRREIVIDISPIAVALVATVAFIVAWSWVYYDRSQGPIIWQPWGISSPITLNGGGDRTPFVFAFYFIGANRSDEPIEPTRAYVISNLNKKTLELQFGGSDPVNKNVIPPKAEFNLVAVVGKNESPPREGISIAAFLADFASFTFIFESPQKNYRFRFDEAKVSSLLEESTKALTAKPKPHVMRKD